MVVLDGWIQKSPLDLSKINGPRRGGDEREKVAKTLNNRRTRAAVVLTGLQCEKICSSVAMVFDIKHNFVV